MNLVKNILCSIALLCSAFVFSQTQVNGVVYDAFGDKIPSVNVYFEEDSTVGTMTDENGEFELSTDQNYRILIFSDISVGEQTVTLTKQITNNLEVTLEEGSSIDEVIVVTRPKVRLKKEENPAYRILRGIWKTKRKNKLKLSKSYEYKKYTSTEVGLNNLDSTFLQKLLKKNYDSVIGIVNQDIENERFYIPISFDEKVENVFGENTKNKERIDIVAEKKTGITEGQGFLLDRIGNTFTPINMSKNTIEVLNKSFVSPIAPSGFATYDYVLQDSTMIDGKNHYRIFFFPRQNGDLAFKGDMVIVDDIFALKRIDMTVHKDINVNFVRDLTFQKNYEIVNDSIFLLKEDTYEGDFTLLTKKDTEKGMYVKRTIVYEDYQFDKTKTEAFYDEKIVQISPTQFKKEDSYWEDQRPTEYGDQGTYTIVENLKNNSRIKAITNLGTVLTSGYLNITSGVQFGSIWSTLGSNDVEGLRVRAGLRTFKDVNDRYRINGYTAYGFDDKKFKYGVEGRYLLSYKPRVTVGAGYLNDVEQLGSTFLVTDELIYQSDEGTNALISRGDNYFLSRVKKGILNVDVQVVKNLNVGLSVSRGEIISAASPSQFTLDYLDRQNNVVDSKTIDFRNNLYVIYRPNRNIYGLGVIQRSGTNLYPTIKLSYQKGIKDVWGSDFNYNKFQIKYNQPILLGKLGFTDFTAEAGKTYGTVPLSLLSPVSSNQSYSITQNTFSLLDFYDFVTDSYVSTNIEHHFDGLIMNRIPLLKKLKLRSVISFKGIYGNVSNDNIAINRSNIVYNAPTKVYYEYGAGIENIGIGNLRFFRLDFVWRSDFQDFNGATSPKFGVRFGFSNRF